MKVVAPSQFRNEDDLAFLAPTFRARKTLEIDLGPVTWISPLGVVSLLAACLSAAGKGKVAVRVLPPDDEAVRRYLGAVGSTGELIKRQWQVGKRATAEAVADFDICLPVTALSNERDVELAAQRLVTALWGQVSGDLINDVYTVATELTSNAREHGSECYLVAQPHTGVTSGTPGLHMAVADFGPGFARTLRGYHPASDADAIIRGFGEGVSGKGLRDRGFGLGFIQGIVDAYGARLCIVSRSGVVARSEGVFTLSEGEDFRGTVASVYFPQPIKR